MSTYSEHLAFLTKQFQGAEAELQGFMAAQHSERVLPYSLNEYQQKRFESGYEDGRTMLEVERTERETNP